MAKPTTLGAKSDSWTGSSMLWAVKLASSRQIRPRALSIVAHDVRHRFAARHPSYDELFHFNLLVHSPDFQVLFFDAHNGRLHGVAQSLDCGLLFPYFACLLLYLLMLLEKLVE